MNFFKSQINIGLTVFLIGISLAIYQLYDPSPPIHTVEKPVTLDSGDENLVSAKTPTVSEKHNKKILYIQKKTIRYNWVYGLVVVISLCLKITVKFHMLV